MSMAEFSSLVTRLEAVVHSLESKTYGGIGGGGDGLQIDLPPYMDDFDVFTSDTVAPYLKASEAIGGVVDEQAKLLKTICDEMRKFLLVVAKHSAPKDASVLQKLIEGMGSNLGKMDPLKNKLDRKSNLVNHVRAASEGVMMFAWVSIPKTPMKQVKESKDSAMFYTNKVLTEFKSSADSAKHKAWVASYLKIFDDLVAYIKEHHTTGPSWNSKGSPATKDAGAGGGAPPPPPAAPVAPPPPPAGSAPPPQPAGPSASAVNALLDQLNQGSNVTKGLKKVTNDMKTHKNPELRKHHAPVPYKASNTSYKPMNKGKATQAPAKPPKCELSGKRWDVEYYEKENLTLNECEMTQTVYAYKCNNTTITVTNKVNSIVLDSCKKTGLVFSNVVSGIEVINCQSVQIQSQGKMPCVSIDKTDGCIIFLSKDCLDTEIVTAKSSEMNVSVPKDDGDFVEYPIVEQFRTTWNAKKKAFITVPSEQLG